MPGPACLQIPLLAVKTGQPRFLQIDWICNAQKKPPYQEASLCLAVRTRLELATPCVTGMYSNQTELPDQLHLHISKSSLLCLIFVSNAGAKVLLFSNIPKFFLHFSSVFLLSY